MTVATAAGLGLIGIGAALLLAAVILPVVRNVEFGFPIGVKVIAAVRERQEELQQAFEAQKGDLQLYSQLLCDQPGQAGPLLEAAWSRAAGAWRGPVNADLRLYVLCVLVELGAARRRWLDSNPTGTSTGGVLSALPWDQRVVVVLHEFGRLAFSQIAIMTGRSMPALEADLRAAEAVLDPTTAPGGPL